MRAGNARTMTESVLHSRAGRPSMRTVRSGAGEWTTIPRGGASIPASIVTTSDRPPAGAMRYG